MNGEFIVLINGKLHTYNNYEEIPNSFDNLIKFKPNIPEPPHTNVEHEEIEMWNTKLQSLMCRETNGRNN